MATIAENILESQRQKDFSISHTVLTNLPELLKLYREKRGLPYRRAAQEIGIAASTLKDFESRSRTCEISTAIAILEWLKNPQYNGRLF